MPPHPQTPDAALDVLMDGNRRHQGGELSLGDHSPVSDRATEQLPFAAIIACADSRVSPTLIFDAGPGNLFVSRIAGNTVDTGTLGSTEYAVRVLGVKLVMVLGHSDCGAVTAALEVARGETSYSEDEHGEIGALVNRIVPAIEALPEGERTLEGCVAANARAQAEELAGRDPIVQPAAAAGKLRVVPAVYDIASGGVTLV